MSHWEKSFVGWTLTAVPLITTIAVAPVVALDPINPPKLLVISVGGFVVLGLALIKIIGQKFGDISLPYKLIGIFLIDLLLVLCLSGVNFFQEFFGAEGRLTGFVTYIAFSGLFLGGVIAASSRVLGRVAIALITAGFFSLAYGLIQAKGADPANWVNSYSPVIGFLGNPNFQSAFIGLSGVMAMALTLTNALSKFVRATMIIYLFACVFIIKESDSVQGFGVLIAGLITIVAISVYFSKFKKFLPIYFSVTGIATGAGILGLLNLGPLKSVLYEPSVTYRGDYWHAGWNMLIHHPILGVGLDNYGDWYRRERTIDATLRRGPDVVSTAAHNVYLDFGSNGGFPLLAIYLLIIATVFRAAIKVFKRSRVLDPIFVGLFAVWISYLLVSAISINQLGVAVWGWVISGLILGYEIVGRENLPPITNVKKNVKPIHRIESPFSAGSFKQISALMLGLILGLAVGLPPLVGSINFKNALETQNSNAVQGSAGTFPPRQSHLIIIMNTLNDNNFNAGALQVAQEAVLKFPDSYQAWKILSTLRSASPAQISQAKAQMKRLDPHNPDLK